MALAGGRMPTSTASGLYNMEQDKYSPTTTA